ncbi:MAG TPA: hypothetical protein VIT65_20510 [Microlunatus sp.]
MPGSSLSPVEASDDFMMGEVRDLTNVSPFIELGVTGLKRASGYVDEEFLPHLKGRKAVQIYREMGDNDPIASAMLFSLVQLLRGVTWTVVPGGKSREHAAGAKLVETCMEDMSQTWDDTLIEILSFLRYGWSWHEIVYKRRQGIWSKDPKNRSKFSDGLIGWDKIPIRSQDTLHRWLFKPSSSVAAMVQLAPPLYETHVLPIEKSLLFRFGAAKNNPEGTSALRGSYRPWYYKKRFEEHESIGVERDLAGLPMVKVPMEYLRAKPGTDQFKMVEAMKKMVRSVRRNEQEGIVFPTAVDEETKQDQFSFELLTSGGTRALNVDAIIQRYEQRQLMTILADFIMVGHQATGTYNLHVDKTGIFREALNATTKSVADIFNRHAIPRLFALNGWKPDILPRIEPTNVDNPDLGQLAQFLSATAGIGFNWGPNADIERFLRKAAGLPELDEQSLLMRRKEERVDEAARFAEQQARLLAARSSLTQALAAEQMLADGQAPPEIAAQQMEMAGAKQQQDFAANEEQRAAADHQFGMQQQIGAAIGMKPKGGEKKK